MQNNPSLPLWGLYERLKPREIEAIQSAAPIAYLPWGALEYHGVHNPVGLDGIKAHALAVDLAKANGGIVIPPVYHAANLIKSYPGVDFKKHSLEFAESLVRSTCQAYFRQLMEADFKIIVCISGHAGEPHIDILREEAEAFAGRYPGYRFWTVAEFDLIEELTPNHSALGETSLQLYYAPETVDLSRLPQDGDITLERDAVAGRDPRTATATYGKSLAEQFLSAANRTIQSLLSSI